MKKRYCYFFFSTVGGVIVKNGDLWTSVNPAQKCFGLTCQDGKHSAVYLCKGFPSPPPPPATTTIIPSTIQTTLSSGALRANRFKSSPTTAPIKTITATITTPTTTTTSTTPATTPTIPTTSTTTTLSIAEEGSGFYLKNKNDYYNRKNVIFDG